MKAPGRPEGKKSHPLPQGFDPVSGPGKRGAELLRGVSLLGKLTSSCWGSLFCYCLQENTCTWNLVSACAEKIAKGSHLDSLNMRRCLCLSRTLPWWPWLSSNAFSSASQFSVLCSRNNSPFPRHFQWQLRDNEKYHFVISWFPCPCTKKVLWLSDQIKLFPLLFPSMIWLCQNRECRDS